MARVVAYIPDLLFGSQVQGALRAAGHEVELAAGATSVRRMLYGADVLIMDLTDEATARLALVSDLAGERLLDGTRSLAFYSHVEAGVRERAEAVGFDVVAPRSRMAREGSELVERLVVER